MANNALLFGVVLVSCLGSYLRQGTSIAFIRIDSSPDSLVGFIKDGQLYAPVRSLSEKVGWTVDVEESGDYPTYAIHRNSAPVDDFFCPFDSTDSRWRSVENSKRIKFRQPTATTQKFPKISSASLEMEVEVSDGIIARSDPGYGKPWQHEFYVKVRDADGRLIYRGNERLTGVAANGGNYTLTIYLPNHEASECKSISLKYVASWYTPSKS